MQGLMLAPEDGMGELCASSNIAAVSLIVSTFNYTVFAFPYAFELKYEGLFPKLLLTYSLVICISHFQMF